MTEDENNYDIYNHDIEFLNNIILDEDINQVPKRYRDILENSVTFKLTISFINKKACDKKYENNIVILNKFLNKTLPKYEEEYSIYGLSLCSRHMYTNEKPYKQIYYKISKRLKLNFELQYDNSRNFLAIHQIPVILFTKSKMLSTTIKLNLT